MISSSFQSTSFKAVRFYLTLGLLAFSIASQAGTSHLVKTEREDFGAMIQEGLSSQENLRREVREKAGLPTSKKSWDREIKENGRVLMGKLGAEERVSPTTRYVRRNQNRPTAQDIQQERMGMEMPQFEE